MVKQDLLAPDWPGFDFIFFDCDSTLSSIEGIDELARQKGKFDEVKQLTDKAMDGEIHLQSIYDRRLDLLRPTRAEIRDLQQHYRQTLVPDVIAVIQALHHMDKELFIVSGGLLAAVGPFGEWLGISRHNIRAVDVRFDLLSGQWWDYMQDMWGQRPDVVYMDPEETPLIESHGKADVVRELLGDRQGRAMLIGDGMSDMAARSAVDLVVGFGGVVIREHVLTEAKVFIKSNSLAPILPLALSQKEQATLSNTIHKTTLKKGWTLIQKGDMIFKDS